MDDEFLLPENSYLYAADNRGVFIPQFFAQSVKREFVEGVSEEQYNVLLAGPDHEHYWEVWTEVLDRATINDPDVGPSYLYQDGDLWVVPKGA